MKIAVTGHKGKLGSRLINLGAEPLSCDVTDADEVREELRRVKPDVIIHTASMSGIDECEADKERAMLVNFRGTVNVCEQAEKVVGPGKVIVISTDQVFDGAAGPYFETDDPSPVNFYGTTKHGAEAAASLYGGRVFRISRCFDSQNPDIMGYLIKLEVNEEIEVPNIFERSYCHSEFVVQQVWEAANRISEMPKILHLGGSETTSFYNLICQIADHYGYDLDLISSRGEKSGFVKRPHRCGLDTSLARNLGIRTYSIKESIERMKNEIHV